MECSNLKDLVKKEYEYIVEECMLNELESEVLYMRIKGKSIIEISIKTNISTANVSKIIRKIKNKIARMD